MASNVHNGVHGCSAADKYVQPKDPLVLKKLEEFKDRKLGFMMHWAPVTQLGIVESWAMSDSDSEWSQREIDWTDDMDEFRKQYKELHTTFNPIKFNPKKWAQIAKEYGFKYLLFTTKHHDGFCMWDTKTTDYKITSPNCPFHKNEYSDVVKSLYDAFREQGLGIHTYFSKPDWDCPYYWSEDFEWPDGKTDRNVNYNIDENPEIWEKFVQYTHSQITELMTEYGDIDCLWLDGGWVNPSNMGQDIRLGEIVEKMRASTQPGLISSDRTVGGEYENFITPEQSIPSEPILVPWESCITLGESFSFKYDSKYKTPREIIQILIDIVAKGGNLALNITPQPDGNLPQQGIRILEELGEFLKGFGEGIYKTRVCEPYVVDKYSFTKKGDCIYTFYSYDEEESNNTIYLIPINIEPQSVRLLSTGESLEYEVTSEGIKVIVEKDKRTSQYVEAFKIKIN